MTAGEAPMDDETAAGALAGVKELNLIVEELRRLLAVALPPQHAAAPSLTVRAGPESAGSAAMDVGP